MGLQFLVWLVSNHTLIHHNNISISLSIYGLMGSGRTELLEIIMGLNRDFKGEIYLQRLKYAYVSDTDRHKKVKL